MKVEKFVVFVTHAFTSQMLFSISLFETYSLNKFCVSTIKCVLQKIPVFKMINIVQICIISTLRFNVSLDSIKQGLALINGTQLITSLGAEGKIILSTSHLHCSFPFMFRFTSSTLIPGYGLVYCQMLIESYSCCVHFGSTGDFL